MHKERIPKVVNMNVEGKCPKKETKLRWEQQIRKDNTQKERTWEETEKEGL
jgi:hypothetical protein